MNVLRYARILALVFLASISLSSLLANQIGPTAHAATSNVRLEVWSPDVHSSNITNLAFSPGTQFTVEVNVTGAGPLLGFDVSLLYNITSGPNVLQAAHPQPVNPLSGSLFDPLATYPPGCSAIPVKAEIDIPAGRIRYAAVMQGGCTVPGTGTLFSIGFQVISTGATSIDIAEVPDQGRPGSIIVGALGTPPVAASVTYQAFSGYFRNKAGSPPVAAFTFTPGQPSVGDTVRFNGTGSFDPENSLAPDRGIQTEPMVYDTNNNQAYDTGEPVIVGAIPAAGTPLGAPQPYPGCRLGCMFNRPDPHVAFMDQNGNENWDAGETVVYDANMDLKFDTVDFVIAGASLSFGTALATDPKLTYVDSHLNNFWDDGFIWDWGDGSGTASTGNVTSHVFQSTLTVPAAGLFPVKLVVFDSDDSIPNRQIQTVTVGSPPIYDVSVLLEASRPIVTAGEPLGLRVMITNRGNRAIESSLEAIMNVTYDLNGSTTIDSKSGISLPIGGSRVFNYTIDTSPLAQRTYTLTVRADILNDTSRMIVPNLSPDNVAMFSFVVQRPILTHDVGILSVYPEARTVQAGQAVPVHVLVANFGSQTENVTVTLFYDSHIIENRAGIVLPGTSSTNPPPRDLFFLWETTGVTPGTYIISATISLPVDQNPIDNIFHDGPVTILPPPVITLSPSSGVVGVQVVARGMGFLSSPYPTEIEMSFDDQLLGFAFPSNGNFTFTFNVPLADPTKPHQIVASQFGPYGPLATALFNVLPTPPSPSPLEVNVQVGTIYFPGDTAVIYVQTSLNGAPVAPDTLQLFLAMPNGSFAILHPVPLQAGFFKASFAIPGKATAGTYAVSATAHKAGSVDGMSLRAFEVKPSWIRSQAPIITSGAASLALVGVVAVAWRKGYLRKKPED